MDRRHLFASLVIVSLIQFGCSSLSGTHVFKDDHFRFVLVVHYETDCISCVEKGVHLLLECPEEGDEPINIFLLNSSQSKPFEEYIKESVDTRPVRFYPIRNTRLPHPALLLYKGNSPVWHLYLSNDMDTMSETIRRIACIQRGLQTM